MEAGRRMGNGKGGRGERGKEGIIGQLLFEN
jgi:hypothetical protein